MEEDWEILELTGPYNACAVHGPSGGLLYSLGTVIVVWDVMSDKKVNLRCHTSPVTSLSFSTDNEYFISAELSAQPLICLWRWRNLEQLSAKWLPFKPRSSTISAIHSSFSHKKVVISESEADGGYRITIWDVQDSQLNLRLVEDLELNEDCLGVSILNDLLNFACLESKCLKIWSMESCTINKRFHLKTPVKSFEYCRQQSIFALLLKNNSVLLLNQSGKTLALLNNPNCSFTCISSSSDYVYIGTQEGKVLIYNTRSYSQLREIPQTHTSSIRIVKVNSGNMVYTVFEDATVQVLNLSEGQVSNQSSGHSLPLTSTAWADRLNFYSSSTEGCLYVWKYIGRGWNMQAMDVSAGKGEISALSVHPTHRLLAVGFSRGSLKIFQTGDKPKFSTLLQFDNSCVKLLQYSHCGQFLAVLHESGGCFVLNGKNEVIAELEHSRNSPVLLMSIHQIYSSHGLHLLAGTCKEDFVINLQIFKCVKDQLEKIDEKSIEIEGSPTGLAFHPSGNYLLCTSDSGGIFIYSIENGDIVGVIVSEKNVKGCIIDPSGLYVLVFAETSVNLHNRIIVYEIGTGKKASELARLDDINSAAVKWSHDGKYLIIGCLTGLLMVWRIPKSLISTIHDMLASMQSNPFIWQDYPIDLPNKQLAGQRSQKKVKEVIVAPEENRKERGAFVDSVVVLVNRPERPRSSSKHSKISKIHIPEDSFSKTGSRSSTPVSLPRVQKPIIRHTVNDFYYKKPETLTNPKTVKKSPVIVKSSLIGTSKSIESIDVECHAASHNPAHRLYERFDSDRSEEVDFRYH